MIDILLYSMLRRQHRVVKSFCCGLIAESTRSGWATDLSEGAPPFQPNATML
jgi:hypothetical protein